MYDLLITDYQVVSEDNITHTCDGCKLVYGFYADQLATGEETAYKYTVRFLNIMLQRSNNESEDVAEEAHRISSIEIMANSLIYSVTKSFNNILLFLGKGDYKFAEGECRNMLEFIKRNKEHAKNNTLVKVMIENKEK